MKRKNYIFSLLILIFSYLTLPAQDIHFSQVYETPLFLSPANTGFYNGYFRAIANYRNQWAAMNKAYQTQALSIDGGLFRSKKRPAFMGLGLTFFTDQAGVAKVRTTSVQLNVSGLVKLGKNSAMSAGIAFGTTGANAQYNNLTYESQFNGNVLDPTRPTGETPYRQFTALDVGAGLAYEFSRYSRDSDHDDVTSFKITVGGFHLNKPVQDFGGGSNYRMPVKLISALTTLLDFEDTKFSITPTFIYQWQAPYQEIYFGSYLKYRMSTGTKVTGQKTHNAIGLGLFYRRKDAIVPKLICDIGDLSIGFAYDINISNYRAASMNRGGPEISLRYNVLAGSLFESRKEFK